MIRSYEKFKGSKYPVKIDGKKTFFLNNKTTFEKSGDKRFVSLQEHRYWQKPGETN